MIRLVDAKPLGLFSNRYPGAALYWILLLGVLAVSVLGSSTTPIEAAGVATGQVDFQILLNGANVSAQCQAMVSTSAGEFVTVLQGTSPSLTAKLQPGQYIAMVAYAADTDQPIMPVEVPFVVKTGEVTKLEVTLSVLNINALMQSMGAMGAAMPAGSDESDEYGEDDDGSYQDEANGAAGTGNWAQFLPAGAQGQDADAQDDEPQEIRTGSLYGDAYESEPQLSPYGPTYSGEE